MRLVAAQGRRREASSRHTYVSIRCGRALEKGIREGLCQAMKPKMKTITAPALTTSESSGLRPPTDGSIIISARFHRIFGARGATGGMRRRVLAKGARRAAGFGASSTFNTSQACRRSMLLQANGNPWGHPMRDCTQAWRLLYPLRRIRLLLAAWRRIIRPAKARLAKSGRGSMATGGHGERASTPPRRGVALEGACIYRENSTVGDAFWCGRCCCWSKMPSTNLTNGRRWNWHRR
jgi:hypothetical protein